MQTNSKTQSTNTLNTYPSFSERLRPRTFQELLLPDSITSKLNLMCEGSEVMNMIFYGPPGTGKSSCALIFEKSDNFSLYKINAANLNSIDDVKKHMKYFSTSISFYGTKKLVLIDEADKLSQSAQAALRCIIEESVNNCRFIFTTNKLSRIEKPLQSRCMPLNFALSYKEINLMIAKLTNTVHSRLEEIDCKFDGNRISEIVAMNFPDYRAIANAVEFELI
jgi:replication factor C small subunit